MAPQSEVGTALAWSTPRTLTIREITLTPIVVPLDGVYRGSYYRMENRASVITRVVTDEGIVGEAYAADEDKTLAEIVHVIRDEIAPRVIGANAFAYERCWELAYPVTYDQLRDRRIGLVALACVDFALWDAIGKALDQPLWQLWGGYCERLRVNIIGGYYGRDLAGIRDEVAEWRELGFRGGKFKVGALSPAEDAARITAAREAAGDDFVITIDANQGYSLHQALELCERVSGLGIRWFEEPCIWSNDRRDMREVRVRGGIPVCAGQSEYAPGACRDLFETGSVDVCNFDASWCGGYTNWQRMAAVARLYSVQLGHHEEPQVALHLLASQPHGTYVEVFHPNRDPIWWNLIANRPVLEDGAFALPDAPGLGWQLDADFIEQHRVEL
ncbi:MAG: mandelate racemase/muconate lactonizing enzyme family protein [Gaiellaceae bacterium]